jgi:hypothetical protein
MKLELKSFAIGVLLTVNVLLLLGLNSNEVGVIRYDVEYVINHDSTRSYQTYNKYWIDTRTGEEIGMYESQDFKHKKLEGGVLEEMSYKNFHKYLKERD